MTPVSVSIANCGTPLVIMAIRNDSEIFGLYCFLFMVGEVSRLGWQCQSIVVCYRSITDKNTAAMPKSKPFLSLRGPVRTNERIARI